MGVTIHFEGRLLTAAAYRHLVDRVSRFASERSWRTEPIDEPSATLARAKNEEPWDYSGPTKGLAVFPHENCEPVRFEFDRDLFVQEYVKTQFAPIDVHVAVVELLRVVEPEFADLVVCDEGDFWETGDEDVLARHLRACFAAMREQIAADSTLQGPFRLPSGRFADLIRVAQ